MANAYMIEVFGEAAGIVVSERRGFRFYAADERFRPLEKRLRLTPREAEAAAYAIVGRHDDTPAAGTDAGSRRQQGKRR